MPAREHILHKVRTALGRSAGQPPDLAPEPWLKPPQMDRAERVRLMLERFSGKAVRAQSPEEARAYIAAQVSGIRAVASRAPLLRELAIAGVATLPEDPAEARRTCAEAAVGITTAGYAMADTGALVVFAGSDEARLLSLLPEIHITVLRAEQVLTGLDELFTRVPDPAALSSSMVLIGGPSRTADIEQILTLGVHGPREIQLVLLDE